MLAKAQSGDAMKHENLITYTLSKGMKKKKLRRRLKLL